MREIKGFSGYYITRSGGVYSNKGKILKCLAPTTTKKGYLQIGLYLNGKVVMKRVHRLVAEAYLSNYSEDLQVNHMDGDKINNNISNLEMCTNQENLDHSKKNRGSKNFKLLMYFFICAHKY